ncbi:MAG: hypothetical protein JWM73_258, partial [Solirubrobacterales bacterium]|nr:hypothetical protein [Solirubrobacterales bacterium]
MPAFTLPCVSGPSTTIADAIGGVRGMVETSVPAVAFVVAYIVSGSDTRASAGVAVGLAVLLAIGRLIRRESPQYALSGIFGVVLAAVLATKTGKAENFYLPGLLLNVAYASAFLISILVRWPLVGVIASQLQGEHEWRNHPERMRAYTGASWLWVALFLFRLAVQLPLYLAHSVVALGIARTAMGIPLFALGLWWTYRVVRKHADPPAGGAGSA